MSETGEVGRRQQLRALVRVVRYKPKLAGAIIVGSFLAALLEGIGLSFVLPIVEIVQSAGDPTEQADGILRLFVSVYQSIGIPFTLETVLLGVGTALTVRWTLTFVIRWMREVLLLDYLGELQIQSFDYALEAKVEYFDREGSDDILNAIVTQAEYAARVIRIVVNFLSEGLLVVMYGSIALYLSPRLTLFALVLLGGLSALFRYVLEPGYELGDRVANANERVQRTAQAGTQGIRDTKLFGLKRELFDDLSEAVTLFKRSRSKQRRNQQAVKNFYNLLTSVTVFLLIYLAIEFAQLSLGALGVFLFAMFQLGPKASGLNSKLYQLENELPHLVRTQRFSDELQRNSEIVTDPEPVPDEIQSVKFENVRFSYEEGSEEVLSGVSFDIQRGEFVGFVGQSGAGKSTIISLLTRLYEPDDGEITANGRSIHKMDIDEWRSRVAVVRQDPFVFNDTLRYNLTIGNRGVSDAELDWVCEITKVDEFFDELSHGYDTELGDEGVQLSGGQRQRVALARALLKDADVLVLDEATSDLDSGLEKKVQSSIESMDRDYAIISIAHRLSTVKGADRIHTVEDGEIVETGQHEELIARNGQYANLYAIQSRSE